MIKRIGKNLGYWALRGLRALAEALPLWVLYPFSRLLGRAVYHVDLLRKPVVLKNLEIAFGKDRTPAERRAIARKFYEEAAMGLFEFLSLPRFRDGDRSWVEIEGEERLRGALAEGKGTLAVSGHLGSFWMLGAAFEGHGYDYSYVYRDPTDARVAGLFDELRAGAGMPPGIADRPKREAAKKCLKLLRRGGLLFLQVDLTTRSNGIEVEFFGRLVQAYEGSAVLALRTHAPVVPVAILRRPDGRHRVIVGERIPLVETGDPKRDVVANVQAHTRVIEDLIRSHPDQWFWMHDRWRRTW